MAYQQLEN